MICHCHISALHFIIGACTRFFAFFVWFGSIIPVQLSTPKATVTDIQDDRQYHPDNDKTPPGVFRGIHPPKLFGPDWRVRVTWVYSQMIASIWVTYVRRRGVLLSRKCLWYQSIVFLTITVPQKCSVSTLLRTANSGKERFKLRP